MNRGRLVTVLLAAGLAVSSGCGQVRRPTLTERYRGQVYILPGIEGDSRHASRIAKGLRDGGVPAAIEVFDWSTGPGVFFWYIHLADESRNRAQGHRLARAVLRYMKAFPNRPVYLISHSGGIGVLLHALEALPPNRPVEAAILLAAAASPDYDLSRALASTRRGIWNFYSRLDLGFLTLGTAVFGTTDRHHRVAAGAVGFNVPENLSDEDRALYEQKLHQVPYSREMASTGHFGGHLGWASSRFVAHWLAPILLNSDQPGPTGRSREDQTGQPARSPSTTAGATGTDGRTTMHR